ncbi:MAG: hypothetical protein V4556_04620 [Bacteroidota bacterium]
MLNILSILSSVLGITTALVSLYSFFEGSNSRRKTILFLSVLLFTSLAIFFWIRLDNQKEKAKIETLLKEDAHSIAESISITGWENTGEYVGYLTQLSSFYARHKDKFPTENEIYKIQLDNWVQFLKEQREKGKYPQAYTSDLAELKGLVLSGERHMSQIEK